jgi:hypothetical protein
LKKTAKTSLLEIEVNWKIEEVYEIEQAHEIEDEVKRKQGLAALALGKIEEVYKIEGEVIAKNGAIYLTFTVFFVFRVGFAEDPRMGFLGLFFGSIFDLFLDSALLVRDVFQRTFQNCMGVLDPFLGLLLDGLFISARFLSLLGMFHLSRARIYSAGWVSCAPSACFMRPGCCF